MSVVDPSTSPPGCAGADAEGSASADLFSAACPVDIRLERSFVQSEMNENGSSGFRQKCSGCGGMSRKWTVIPENVTDLSEENAEVSPPQMKRADSSVLTHTCEGATVGGRGVLSNQNTNTGGTDIRISVC